MDEKLFEIFCIENYFAKSFAKVSIYLFKCFLLILIIPQNDTFLPYNDTFLSYQISCVA